MTVPIKERTDESKAAYRDGFLAGMEQAEKIAAREGYTSVADAIRTFAEGTAAIFNEIMPKKDGSK